MPDRQSQEEQTPRTDMCQVWLHRTACAQGDIAVPAAVPAFCRAASKVGQGVKPGLADEHAALLLGPALCRQEPVMVLLVARTGATPARVRKMSGSCTLRRSSAAERATHVQN